MCGLLEPEITPRLLPAVDNRVMVLLNGVGGRCVGRVLFGSEEGEDEDGRGVTIRPIFPR